MLQLEAWKEQIDLETIRSKSHDNRNDDRTAYNHRQKRKRLTLEEQIAGEQENKAKIQDELAKEAKAVIKSVYYKNIMLNSLKNIRENYLKMGKQKFI